MPIPPAPLPAPQRYRVEHETRYAYAAPVSQSWQLARLTPRPLPWQTVLSHQLHIEPPPDERHDATDGLGNTVTHFGLHRAHRNLCVRLNCQLDIAGRSALSAEDLSWEQVRNAVRQARTADALEAARLVEPTLLVPLSDAVRHYAAPAFAPGTGWLSAVTQLMQRIHADFEFVAGVTTVSTSVDEVLTARHGVCQDFTHLMLAALREFGLAARYVSGYLLTDPPAGEPRLMGVDATHAWVAAWSPLHGWVEFDPTNNQRADQRYITLAWGADFADVVPLRGVILGGGAQEMQVSVSVVPQ